METLKINRQLIENIDLLKVNHGSPSGEGNILLNPQDNDTVLKIFYTKSGLYFSNKLYTINSLIDLKRQIDFSEIVFSAKLLIIDEKASGFTMPFIKGITLADLLKDGNINIDVKVKYLQEIGKILRKMAQIRQMNPNLNFYLNDLHAKNFIIDNFDNCLKVLDIDSCRIFENHPFLSKYVSSFTPIKDYLQKYNSKIKLTCGGEFIADENTDLYCYVMLVLEFLYDGRVHLMSEKEYFDYLEYLKTIGAPQELVDAFAVVYSNEENINFDYLLDSIPYFLANANRDVYLKRTKSF